MPDPITLPPQASRTIEGLRDTGYDPTDALEDVIDNAITAEANVIVVRAFNRGPGDLVVTVADNGTGMDGDGLINAMTYGSAAKPDPKSLGKFGLGLKTASTSMCRKFTVVSRSSSGGEVYAAAWDLDFVVEKNEWLLLRPDPTAEQVAMLDESAKGDSGTVVIWEKIDRLLPREYVDPGGPAARNALTKRINEFRESIAVTYLKFLRGDDESEPVSIYVGDELVEPWDPFGEDFGSELLFERAIDVDIIDPDGNQSTAQFHLRSFALPPRSELTKEQEDRAQISARNQGFYVFREGRLLSRGWLGLRTIEPHFNLSRIEFSFDHRLDAAFQIDIKKSRVLLQDDLQTALRRLLTPSITEAETRYRKNQRTVATTGAPTTHSHSNNTISKQIDTLQKTDVSVDSEGIATVKNSKGTTRFQINLPLNSSAPHVNVSESLDDGLLWEPTVVNAKQAVQLNAGHPFYERVYNPNKENGTAIQGLDFLFWGLCEAEWAVMSQSEAEHMRAVRREVSRVVRQLALELPDQVVDG